MTHVVMNEEDEVKKMEALEAQKKLLEESGTHHKSIAAMMSQLNDLTGSLLEGAAPTGPDVSGVSDVPLGSDDDSDDSSAGVLGSAGTDQYKNVGALGSDGKDVDTSKGVLSNQDPESPTISNDPYSNEGFQKEIMAKIKAMYDQLKANPAADITAELSAVLGDFAQFGNNQVGQAAEAQTMMTGLTKVSSYVQNCINDKSGTKDQYPINPYTGEQEKDKPKVTAEDALNNAVKYLHDNAFSQYQLGKDGKPVMERNKAGQLVKKPNKLYNFFNDPAHPGNKALMESIKTNIESVTTALGGTTDDLTIPKGAIAKMWKDDAGDYTKSPPVPSNPATLNAVNSGMGSLGQSLNSGGSAMQAVAKILVQGQQAELATFNKSMQSEMSVVKAMVSGQKASG
jgi:hypothetical protein